MEITKEVREQLLSALWKLDRHVSARAVGSNGFKADGYLLTCVCGMRKVYVGYSSKESALAEHRAEVLQRALVDAGVSRRARRSGVSADSFESAVWTLTKNLRNG